MSGAKRKTKYRKHVEEGILSGTPEPGPGDMVALVLGSRGGNLIEVRAPDGETMLCLLPARFRKVVWIKRGNYVIATSAGEDFATASGGQGKVKSSVKHILFKDQIKHLREVGLWPEAFKEQAGPQPGEEGAAAQAADAAAGSAADSAAARGLEQEEEEEVEDDDDDDDEASDDSAGLFKNNNRRGGSHGARAGGDADEDEDED
jgi:probable RNA-binding protein EIF1AD